MQPSKHAAIVAEIAERRCVMKNAKPAHCHGCRQYNNGATPRTRHWCCKHGTKAARAVSVCLIQGSKEIA